MSDCDYYRSTTFLLFQRRVSQPEVNYFILRHAYTTLARSNCIQFVVTYEIVFVEKYKWRYLVIDVFYDSQLTQTDLGNKYVVNDFPCLCSKLYTWPHLWVVLTISKLHIYFCALTTFVHRWRRLHGTQPFDCVYIESKLF